MTTGLVVSVTDELVAELEALASKATPGPWQHVEGDDDPDASWAMQFPIVTSETREIIGTEGFYSDKQIDEENAAFVAAANPTTILALLAERAELKRDAERYQWLRDNWFQIYGESKGCDGIRISIGDIWNHAGVPAHVDAAIDAAMQSEAKQ